MGWIMSEADQDYKPITLEAMDLVFGPRNVDYGHPLDDFSCTALMWTAYLRHRGLLKDDAEVVAEDFGPMMILAKVSRQANAPKRDNMTDTAGYAETTERVIYERGRRTEIAVNEQVKEAQDAMFREAARPGPAGV